MSRLKQRAEQKRKQEQVGQESFWQELCRRVSARQLIPIISNAVMCDPIFDIDCDQIIGSSVEQEEDPRNLTIEEQLAEAWAEEIGYPLPEAHWLPRVAMYSRIAKSHDDREARTRYLYYLKDSLLFLAEEDKKVKRDRLKELRDSVEQLSLADIAQELQYPCLAHGQINPLRLLAQLNLPIYITTSYFDFMERALRANGRTPRTQMCFWAGEPTEFVDDKHRIDHKFEPSAENPLVYHLYGLEAYPESMVLSEDDYLDLKP